jgi:short subunit dehydrogenase-like uncharacterized protein
MDNVQKHNIYAVQCMPTGTHYWDITTEKNICRPFKKICGNGKRKA